MLIKFARPSSLNGIGSGIPIISVIFVIGSSPPLLMMSGLLLVGCCLVAVSEGKPNSGQTAGEQQAKQQAKQQTTQQITQQITSYLPQPSSKQQQKIMVEDAENISCLTRLILGYVICKDTQPCIMLHRMEMYTQL